jgi:hypothetical protein
VSVLGGIGKTETSEQHTAFHADVAGQVVHPLTLAIDLVRTTPATHLRTSSSLFHEPGLQLHRSDAVDLAVDVMVAIDQYFDQYFAKLILVNALSIAAFGRRIIAPFMLPSS